MKTILIATDFSEASRNAAVYALALANEINATIFLFNAYKVPRPVGSLAVNFSRYDAMMQTDKRLLDDADKIDPGQNRMEIVCDEGEAAATILNFAKEKSVDFIVIGMKEGDKNIKKIFGSTATELVQTCTIPVIIVPENAGYAPPKKLVYATDSIVPESSTPVELREIAELFGCTLLVIKVAHDNAEIQFDENDFVQRNLADIGKANFQYVVDSDVTDALDKFITKHQAGMLVMMPHKHDWLERLFKKSKTKEMIFQIHIPILILPESKENIHRYLQKGDGELQLNSK